MGRDEDLYRLLRLRLAVGALGEREHWWGTSASDPSSKGILQNLFPQTWELASMSATAEAAKRVHRGVLTHRAEHLFRFQTEIEQDLRHCLTTPVGKRIYSQTLESYETAERTLEELADKGVHLREGAIDLGSTDPKDIYGAIGQMAANYLLAFRKGLRSYPYFHPEDKDE